MGWFSSQFADPCQRLGLVGHGAEGLSAFASLPSRSAPFPRGTQLHHGDTAVELGHGTEYLPDQATGGVVQIGREICSRVRGDHLAAGTGQLLEDELTYRSLIHA